MTPGPVVGGDPTLMGGTNTAGIWNVCFTAFFAFQQLFSATARRLEYATTWRLSAKRRIFAATTTKTVGSAKYGDINTATMAWCVATTGCSTTSC